jgi:hypothetical protein
LLGFGGELCRRRVDEDEPTLGPEHRPDVERRALGEEADPFLREGEDFLGGFRRLEPQPARRADDALAVKVEIGGDPLERPGPVEHRVGEPGGVGRRRHERHGAFLPATLEVTD